MGAIATSSGSLSRDLKMQRALVDNRSVRYAGPAPAGRAKDAGVFCRAYSSAISA